MRRFKSNQAGLATVISADGRRCRPAAFTTAHLDPIGSDTREHKLSLKIDQRESTGTLLQPLIVGIVDAEDVDLNNDAYGKEWAIVMNSEGEGTAGGSESTGLGLIQTGDTITLAFDSAKKLFRILRGPQEQELLRCKLRGDADGWCFAVSHGGAVTIVDSPAQLHWRKVRILCKLRCVLAKAQLRAAQRIYVPGAEGFMDSAASYEATSKRQRT